MERNLLNSNKIEQIQSPDFGAVVFARIRTSSIKKLSKSDFTHFLLVWLFVAKCTYYFSIVPRVNWTSRVSFATVFSTWKKTFWRDISVLYNWHVEMENLKLEGIKSIHSVSGYWLLFHYLLIVKITFPNFSELWNIA